MSFQNLFKQIKLYKLTKLQRTYWNRSEGVEEEFKFVYNRISCMFVLLYTNEHQRKLFIDVFFS